MTTMAWGMAAILWALLVAMFVAGWHQGRRQWTKQHPPATVAVNKFSNYGLRQQLRVCICLPEDPNDPEEGFSIHIDGTQREPAYGLLFILDSDGELTLCAKRPEEWYGTAPEVVRYAMTREHAKILREVLKGLRESTKPRESKQ